jgi:hypothetical protein
LFQGSSDVLTPEEKDDERLTEYLLGRLNADDQALLEEQYLADPHLHATLRAVERDLIDRYVRGELVDPVGFEKHYLSSPSRRAKVEFARTLIQWSKQTSPAHLAGGHAARSRFGLGGAFRSWQIAATVAIIVVGSWFVLGRRDPASGNRSETTERATTAVQPSQPPSPPEPLPPPPSTGAASPALATFVLLPGLARSGDETPTLRLDAGSDVRLQLELESGDYSSYRAVVRTASGQEIWRQDQLKLMRSASGQAIAITISSGRFADEDYTVRVAGVTAAGEVEELSGYAFRVRMRR